ACARVDAAHLEAGQGRARAKSLHAAQRAGIASPQQGLGRLLRRRAPAAGGDRAPRAGAGGGLRRGQVPPPRSRARAPAAPQEGSSAARFDLPLDTPPMEATTAEALPTGEGWQYEPKWDGFRCLAYKAGPEVDLRAKSGKPLGRYFPEMVALLAAVPRERFVLDGELVIEIDGAISFDALQMRLHPAESRIRKLALETPALLMLFDVLIGPDGARVLEQPLRTRRALLESLAAEIAVADRLVLSPCTRSHVRARRW